MIDVSLFVSVLAVLVGVVVGSARVRGRGGDVPVLGVGDLVVAVGAAVLVVAVEVAVTGVGGFFGLAALASRLVFGIGPATVVLTRIVAGGEGTTSPVRWLVGLAAVSAIVGVYATHVEPFWLRVDRLDVLVTASTDDPIRIGVLADIQTDAPGRHERRAVDAVMAADPDLVLIAGDVFQGSDRQLAVHETTMRAILQQLDAPHGVWIVEGDIDRRDQLIRLLHGTDIRLLDDEVVELDVRGQAVLLGGNRIDWTTPSAVATRRTLAEAPEDALVILLAHRPDAVLDLPTDSAVDLVVAGHTHGGQVVIPGFGPPVTFTDVPRHVARGGLHEIDGSLLYLSSGVGVERAGAPRLRLFSRPSVGILDLVSSPLDGPAPTR